MVDINILKLLNYYDLDYAYLSNIETQTNNLVCKEMNEFRNKYSKEIKGGTTFIFQYENNIYSLLAYRMIKNIQGLLNFNMKIYGKIRNEQEKEMFKDVTLINYHKAKRIKNSILISPFNPICNVETDKTLSKFFNEVFYPIIHFTPKELETLQNFYIDKESPLFKENIAKETEEIEYYYNLFENLNNYEINQNFDKDINFIYYILSGTEDDFGIYEIIRENDKAGFINIYITDNPEFLINNLNNFISGKNRANINYNITNTYDSNMDNTILNFKDYITK